MNFLIADTFTAAFNRLSGQDQKAVKASVFDLQMDPSGNGLQLHRIDKSKDPNFWSARVNRDVRLIVHKTSDSMLVAYVDHHDAAYAWAERRRIEAHPRTGAVQIVEVRERVEEIAPPATFDFVFPEAASGKSREAPALFAALDDDALLSVGVPADWIADVRAATEDGFFALAEHLPAEASEALLEYAATGTLPKPAPVPVAADPFAHPDALRRIRPIADQEELEQALAFPWEKWGVFLHPSQRELVDRTFNGPARVAGSAGTGKTIVAIHRAVRLARENPSARILLASFSQPLADAMAKKLLVLAPETGGIVPRIITASFHGIAEQMFQLEHGARPRIASELCCATGCATRPRRRTSRDFRSGSCCPNGPMSSTPGASAPSTPIPPCSAWAARAGSVPTSASGSGRFSRRCGRRLLPSATRPGPMCSPGWRSRWPRSATKPFDHVILDEAQDLAPAELRFFAALAPATPDALFLSGDMGQRIFQHPYSWASLGVDVRGRSHTLKVCYRTSQQIRRAADRCCRGAARCRWTEDERRGIISASFMVRRRR